MSQVDAVFDGLEKERKSLHNTNDYLKQEHSCAGKASFAGGYAAHATHSAKKHRSKRISRCWIP